MLFRTFQNVCVPFSTQAPSYGVVRLRLELDLVKYVEF
jgi:hypothetical protein